MQQTRLFIMAGPDRAQRISRLLEAEFEEEGLPVAAYEVDEDRGIWCVSVYAATAGEAKIAQHMRNVLSKAGEEAEIGSEALDEQTDWVAATLAALKPVRAGRFVIHGSHDRNAPRPHETGLLIDAGLAFGTGHHGTTAGCLAMFDRLLRRREFRNVLDLGTGSGVLAIAAAKSQPLRAMASDIDPVAVEVARENARINGVAGRVRCVTAAGFGKRDFAERRPFDLIFANILARPLEKLARDLARHCAAQGVVVLSGLLAHQQARIVAAYRAQGLRLVAAHHRDGWLTLVMEKVASQSGFS